MRIRWISGLALLVPLLALLLPRPAAAQQSRRWLADPATEHFGAQFTNAAMDLVNSRDGWAAAGSAMYRFDGRYWRLSHRFTIDTVMYDVDMASATSGWAVGTKVFRTQAAMQIARFDGTTWTAFNNIIQKDGSALSMSGTLSDVQTLADGTAMAIGYSYPGPVVLRYDGTNWSNVTPDGWGPGVFNTLRMVSPTEGWAAGTFEVPETNGRRPALLHYQNGQWTEAQLPAFAGNYAVDLAMRDAGEGWAVFGNAPLDGNSCHSAQLLHYQNGQWTLVPQANHSAKVIGELELIPGTNRGWATLLDCAPSSRPLTGRIARFDNGVFTPEPAGAAIMPQAYALLDDTTQVAMYDTTFMRWSDERLPTERAQPFSSGGLYFETTGHNVTGRFQQYYKAHGLDMGDPGTSARESLALFGYPLSEVFSEINPETGELLEVQYFERARMEYHPEKAEPYKVLLGRLTVASLTRSNKLNGLQPSSAGAGCNLFAETGYQLCPPLRAAWERNGGLPVFGFPLTEAADEQSRTDGKLYLTQYFERERLEYHPELRGTPYEVLLGLLGAEELRVRGYIE